MLGFPQAGEQFCFIDSINQHNFIFHVGNQSHMVYLDFQ